MTLREEITKSRNEMYANIERASDQDDLEKLIDRIDDLTERLHRIEIKLFNISVNQQPVSSIPTVPSDRYCDLFEQLMAAIGDRNKPEPEPKTEE